LPSLGDTPLGAASGAAALNAESAAFDGQWQQDIYALNALGITVVGVDVNSLFNQLLTGADGFTNTTTPCQNNPLCTNPNQYVFWDVEHPTTEADMYVANLAAADLAAVPEPATYGMLLLGAFGIFALARARRRTAAVNSGR